MEQQPVRQRILLFCVCAFVASATPVFADPAPSADYSRSGWYVGVGAGGASDFLDSAIEDLFMGLVESGSTGTANVRAGYRVTSWFAAEAFYEGVYGLETLLLGVPVASFSFHSLLANAKFIIPIKRFQPYIPLGVGVQWGDFNDVADVTDTARSDFHFRTGVGLDVYITEHWLVNGELGVGARVARFTEIGSEITDNVTLTYTFGAQYRF
jgi:opacity protein-like surface antigen